MVALIMNIDEETQDPQEQRECPKVGQVAAGSAGAETQGPEVGVPLQSGRSVVLCILGPRSILGRFLNVNS